MSHVKEALPLGMAQGLGTIHHIQIKTLMQGNQLISRPFCSPPPSGLSRKIWGLESADVQPYRLFEQERWGRDSQGNMIEETNLEFRNSLRYTMLCTTTPWQRVNILINGDTPLWIKPSGVYIRDGISLSTLLKFQDRGHSMLPLVTNMLETACSPCLM